MNLGGAEACRRCGASPNAVAAVAGRPAPRSYDHAGLAAALSTFVPGLGQLYTGRIRRALIAFAAPIAGAALLYMLFSLASPLLAALLRVAVGVAAAGVAVLAGYHSAVVLDAFGAPSKSCCFRRTSR